MRKVSQFVEHYYFEDFILKLDHSIHLVEVEFVARRPSQLDHVTTLPEWVFAPDAIWVRYAENDDLIHTLDPSPIKQQLIDNAGDRRSWSDRRRGNDRRSYRIDDRRAAHHSIERHA